MAMRAPKYAAPNLENSTPEMLIDESAKLSVIENYVKKLRKTYKEALHARLNYDPKKPLRGQFETLDAEGRYHHRGEDFIGTIEQYGQDRFDTTTFRADHPDLYAKYCKASTISKITFDLVPENKYPDATKLMELLKAELGLDDLED